MDRLAGGRDCRAHRFRDDLHAETNPQDRNAAAKGPHHIRANAGLMGPERAGRNHNAVRMECGDLTKIDAVRAVNLAPSARGLKSVHQIPGKGIVVVEN